ncbi:uncharacterized protein LOC144051022 [Vanacampus margaritifer]
MSERRMCDKTELNLEDLPPEEPPSEESPIHRTASTQTDPVKPRSEMLKTMQNEVQRPHQRPPKCPSEKCLYPEQKKADSLHIKQEESKQLHIKEEEEPECRNMQKEEPPHGYIKEPEQRYIKDEEEEYDVTIMPLIVEVKSLKSKEEPQSQSAENSRAEAPSGSSNQHVITESDGDPSRRPQIDNFLALLSADDDDVTSHSSDTDNLAPLSDDRSIKEEDEEYDVTELPLIAEVKSLRSKDELKDQSEENSGAEPQSQHITESDGRLHVDNDLALLSDDDDVASCSSDTDNLTPSSDESDELSYSSDTDNLPPSDDDDETSHSSDTYNDKHFNSDVIFNPNNECWECSHCEQTFDLVSHLKNHMCIHTGQKRYTCKVCGKKFPRDALDLPHRFHNENISRATLMVVNMAAFNMDTVESRDNLSFSCILSNMDDASKKRYLEKLDLAGIRDPYTLPDYLFLALECCKVHDLPNLHYYDILNYIMRTTWMHTHKAFREYKNLNAYKYFDKENVRRTGVWEIPGKERFLITSKVTHSHLENEPPVRVWVVVQKTGSVQSCHCTCMSYLCEYCSHAVATLFAVETHLRMAHKMTGADVRHEQTQAPSTKVPYSEVADLDTANPMRKKRMKEEANEDVTVFEQVRIPTSPEKAAFEQTLSESVASRASRSVSPDVKRSTAISELRSLPPPLTRLYQSRYEQMSEKDLRKVADEVFKNMKITEEQVSNIEKETRTESAWSTTVWYQQRAGRVTAPDFKALTQISVLQPSLSLINRICYPGSCKLSPEDTRWGCKHVQTALKQYSSIQGSYHQAFTTRECGLVVWKENPHMGASPDSIVRCACCGVGCVQIKCFHCLQQESLTAVDHDHSFYCCRDDWCEIPLKQDDAYYFRVQSQIKITNSDYCDCVMWRNDKMSIQRIKFNASFFNIQSGKVNLAYRYIILPELLGKLYSRRVR